MKRKHIQWFSCLVICSSSGAIATGWFNNNGYNETTTTTSPPQRNYGTEDDGLYYPYGSRTSTTTGPPNGYTAGYEDEEEGLYYPYGSRTSTTTGVPYTDYTPDESNDDGLYYPYGSRTSTTTGPPYSHPYGLAGGPSFGYEQQQRMGLFPGDDYSSTSTSPPGSYDLGARSWDSDDAIYHNFDSDNDDGFNFTSSTTTTTTLPPMAGRYPTQILSVVKPSEAARNRCRFTITVSEMTEGRRAVLKRGTTELFIHPSDDGVMIRAVSDDQRPPPTSFWGQLWRRIKDIFTGGRERYYYDVVVPPQCGRLYDDPAAVAAEVREGEDIRSVIFRLSPEITGFYGPSYSSPTFYYDASRAGENRFEELRRCLFGAEITQEFIPRNLVFSASQRVASVTSRDSNGNTQNLASLEVPCECRPSRLRDISWWVTKSAAGFPLVLLYIGYGDALRHSTCIRRIIRQGTLEELDQPVDYEALGFWAD